jgi:hypothetical protein
MKLLFAAALVGSLLGLASVLVAWSTHSTPGCASWCMLLGFPDVSGFSPAEG